MTQGEDGTEAVGRGVTSAGGGTDSVETVDVGTATEGMESTFPGDRDVRVYSRRKLFAGSYLGGPFVAVYMLSRNFVAAGRADRARQTWIWGILGTLVLFVAMGLIPEDIFSRIPKFVVPLVYTFLARAVFDSQQRAYVEGHVAASGQEASVGRTIAVTLGGLAALLAVMAPVLLAIGMTQPVMEGDMVMVGSMEHEVFYESPVSEIEARRVGELIDPLFFSQLDGPAYMKVEVRAQTLTLLFPVTDNAWQEAEVVEFYLSLGRALDGRVMTGQASVVLFYEGLSGRDEHALLPLTSPVHRDVH